MTAAALDITSVLQNVLSLPHAERSYLAERLIFSLEDDRELSPAWRAELDSRVLRRRGGETRAYSREEVSAHIDSIIG